MNETRTTTETVDTFLAERGIKADIRLIGDACTPFCMDKNKPDIGTFPRRTHIHGQHYQLTLSQMVGAHANVYMIDFWNSYHNAEMKYNHQKGGAFVKGVWRKAPKPEPVTAADILGCAQFSDPGMFEDFCIEFDYDEDSRKAESVWRACCQQYRDLTALLGSADRDALAEIVREM